MRKNARQGYKVFASLGGKAGVVYNDRLTGHFLFMQKRLSRFFFDHVGAKRKAHFAPQSCKKKAPKEGDFALCGARQGLRVLDRAAF